MKQNEQTSRTEGLTGWWKTHESSLGFYFEKLHDSNQSNIVQLHNLCKTSFAQMWDLSLVLATNGLQTKYEAKETFTNQTISWFISGYFVPAHKEMKWRTITGVGNLYTLWFMWIEISRSSRTAGYRALFRSDLLWGGYNSDVSNPTLTKLIDSSEQKLLFVIHWSCCIMNQNEFPFFSDFCHFQHGPLKSSPWMAIHNQDFIIKSEWNYFHFPWEHSRITNSSLNNQYKETNSEVVIYNIIKLTWV